VSGDIENHQLDEHDCGQREKKPGEFFCGNLEIEPQAVGQSVDQCEHHRMDAQRKQRPFGQTLRKETIVHGVSEIGLMAPHAQGVKRISLEVMPPFAA